MHIHFLGICGTFMGSLAVLAKQLGYRVTGSDQNVYPPMSTQLEAQGIKLIQGFDPEQLSPAPDMVVVGNAMSRGNPCVEAVLNLGLPYTSGPQWLCDHVLQKRWVVAVAGTHGKTTTSSMVAWVLAFAGLKPGYLIGGVPNNFPASADLGQTDFFVIEADEYDSAFFDKRSKFVHYRPRTLVLNNLEFDHADIFDDLSAIQKQFHHLIRTVPSIGEIILPARQQALEDVLGMGCWSNQIRFDIGVEGIGDFRAEKLEVDGTEFKVLQKIAGDWIEQGRVKWKMTGDHSVANGLAALLAARHCGVSLETGVAALSEFEGVKRRMELVGEEGGVKVFDDFAHHPTAIATTLQGAVANKYGSINSSDRAANKGRILAVIEPRSNTMKQGIHKDQLKQSVELADRVFWFEPEGLSWDFKKSVANNNALVTNEFDALIEAVLAEAHEGDWILVMSNGGFGGIHQKLLDRLKAI